MAFFSCSECNSKMRVKQISSIIKRAGEMRIIQYVPVRGVQLFEWEEVQENDLEKEDGFYCPNCGTSIYLEPEEMEVCEDHRIPAIVADEFSAELLSDKLVQLAQKEESTIFVQVTPLKEAQFKEVEIPLPHSLRQSLDNMKIRDLYTHQVDSLNAIRNGANIVLVTSTSSGKTLSYNLPILENLYTNPQHRALYLFPTKALANDQFYQINRFSNESAHNSNITTEWIESAIHLGDKQINVGKLDGDTPIGGPRDRIISNAHIWMSNPDMIHHSILSQVNNHRYRNAENIRLFLKNLKFLVIDEMHIYRGTFGSHVALVIRRLLKVCIELGNKHIQIITSSATIENPSKLATDLTGNAPFVVIDSDGSQQKQKRVFLWNPGKIIDTNSQRSPSTEAISIIKNALTDGQKVPKTRIFQPSRTQTMVFTKYIKDVLRQPLRLSKDKVQGERLVAYYTGILPDEVRRRIIDKMKTHHIHVIVSTNALEVGIDIGDLSVAILVGYPGSKAAFSQQIGRVGRKGEGVAILIMQDDPLQQYYMRNPTEFFNKAPEVVRINPSNQKLLAMHIPLLQEELGRALTKKDIQEFVVETDESMIQTMIELASASDHTLERFSLRSISNKTFIVKEKKRGEVIIDSLDEWSAIRDYHEGAVHWTPGDQTYVVDSINRNRGEILLTSVRELDYFTQSMAKDTIDLLSVSLTEENKMYSSSYGELNVKRIVYGYKKLSITHKHELETVNKGPYTTNFSPQGTWFTISDSLWSSLEQFLSLNQSELIDHDTLAVASLQAAEHGISSVIPDVIICDQNDFSGFSGVLSSFGQNPVIGFYGENGGGLGTMEAIYEKKEYLIQRALHLITSCLCIEGCPKCVHLPRKTNEQLYKPGAVFLLERLMELEGNEIAPYL